jgi:hypothetical protein
MKTQAMGAKMAVSKLPTALQPLHVCKVHGHSISHLPACSATCPMLCAVLCSFTSQLTGVLAICNAQGAAARLVCFTVNLGADAAEVVDVVQTASYVLQAAAVGVVLQIVTLLAAILPRCTIRLALCGGSCS